jgi:hypothetical protein
MSSAVYPIGLLVMGTELQMLEPRATLRRVQGLDLEGPPVHHVCPCAYNVTRFASAGLLVPFVVVRKYSTRIESIHALGPALIEAVIFCGTDILYAKDSTTDVDGKLFYCPHRVLERQLPLEIRLRCVPELFMLGGPNVEQSEDWSEAKERLAKSHDPSQCDDCADFRKRTGLES